MTIESTYLAKTNDSNSFERRGHDSLPVVSSRGIAYHTPYPLLIEKAQGAFVWDADGTRYVDLASNLYTLVHGNAYPPIVEAVTKQLADGSVWPANGRSLLALAETLRTRMPSLERMMFCNSGTEAFSLALNIARGVTGKHKFLMAAGGWHGQTWDAAQGSKGLAGPSHYVATYGDTDSFVKAIETHADELCAVFLEPVLGSGGLAVPPDGFLSAVQAACKKAGLIFVLDEIITFRLSTGGSQKLLGLKPDLTMLGKAIGGGFPVGAVGGREDLLAVVDGSRGGKVMASGTFSGNPITMTAGSISVAHLTQERIDQLASWAKRLEQLIVEASKKVGVPIWTRRVGSMINWHFFDPGTGSVSLATRPDVDRVKKHHLALLNHGLFAIPRAALVLSTVMTDELIHDIGLRFERSLVDLSVE